MSIVVVPVAPAPNWSPAMDPILPGETARCGLDARQWAARRGLTVLSVGVATDPTLSLAAPPVMVNDVCLFDLVAPSATEAGLSSGVELSVVFSLAFAEDAALTKIIAARLPVRGSAVTELTTPAVAIDPDALIDATGYLADANGVLIQ